MQSVPNKIIVERQLSLVPICLRWLNQLVSTCSKFQTRGRLLHLTVAAENEFRQEAVACQKKILFISLCFYKEIVPQDFGFWQFFRIGCKAIRREVNFMTTRPTTSIGSAFCFLTE
jgi:hypothetical protein